MAVQSMTGFGRGETTKKGYKITVELSSVNRKQFDFNISMPREFTSYEAKLSSLVSSVIKRGYVKGMISVERCSSKGNTCEGMDLKSAQLQIAAMREIAEKLNLEDDLTASSLFKVRDSLKNGRSIDEPDQLWPDIENCVKKALKKLKEMRTCEGDVLEKDIRKRLKLLQKTCAQIAKIAPLVPVCYKKMLEQRLNKLLEKESLVDQDSLAREIALFADRCDISEELTRIKSHFLQTDEMLIKGGVCGRKFDFICQEMFREINTTGSKASNADISRHVISFKAGLEAVREQVQNIE